MVASEVRDFAPPQLWEAEEFRNNALGSVWYSRHTTLSDGAEQSRSSSLDSHQALRGTGLGADTVPTGTCLNAQVWQDTVFQALDGSGNVRKQAEYKRACGGSVVRDMAAMSFFSGDNRLAALQRYDTPNGTWEEYRYDALGRRVLERARLDSLCVGGPDVCVAFVQRTAWDGNQVLLEERHNGNDFGDGAPHYGTVGYVHGVGIDEPLEILDFRFSNPRIPHTNWRGLAESSSWPDGTPADCSLMGGPCTTIAWPAGQGVYFRPVSGPAPPPVDTWVGSLASNGQDGTGQLYRRNRYLDPLTGRFTQEDPISLAGSLNLYGFAGGDPINFTDPFGLDPCKNEQRGNCTQGQEGKIGYKNERKIAQLRPDARAKAEEAMEIAGAGGMTLFVDQTYRTVKQQNEYYEQGASNCKGANCPHPQRRALDVYPVRNGQPLIRDATSSDMQGVGQVGKAAGFEWGGEWSPERRDPPHWEVPQH